MPEEQAYLKKSGDNVLPVRTRNAAGSGRREGARRPEECCPVGSGGVSWHRKALKKENNNNRGRRKGVACGHKTGTVTCWVVLLGFSRQKESGKKEDKRRRECRFKTCLLSCSHNISSSAVIQLFAGGCASNRSEESLRVTGISVTSSGGLLAKQRK